MTNLTCRAGCRTDRLTFPPVFRARHNDGRKRQVPASGGNRAQVAVTHDRGYRDGRRRRSAGRHPGHRQATAASAKPRRGYGGWPTAHGRASSRPTGPVHSSTLTSTSSSLQPGNGGNGSWTAMSDPSMPCGPGRPADPSDNGLLSGTSGHDAWRGPGNGRPAVCDSGTLSGTSAEEERRRRCGHRASQTPSTVQRRRSNCRPAPDNPRRTAALRQIKHVPLQAAGHLDDHSWLFLALEPARGRAEARASIRRSAWFELLGACLFVTVRHSGKMSEAAGRPTKTMGQ
jgi:hypothetical protein